MNEGRVVAEGTPDEIRNKATLRRIYMGAIASAEREPRAP
jgi:ABC-type branched-subunit amino acid transport system ATPase component